MAKLKAAKKKPKKKVGGPFLAVAVFCDNILEETDKALTVVKIHDGYMIVLPHDAPADIPSKEKQLPLMQWMLLSFRSGDSPGEHQLRVIIESPSGKRSKAIDGPVMLSNEPNGGHNNRVHLGMSVYSSGTYWFEVYLDRKLYTKMPLQITIKRLAEGESPPNAHPFAAIFKKS